MIIYHHKLQVYDDNLRGKITQPWSPKSKNGHVASGMQNSKIYYHSNNKDKAIRRLLFSKQNAYLLHLTHFWKKPKALILPPFLALSRTIWSHWIWSNCFWSMLPLKINKSGRIWPWMSTWALHPALEVNKLGKKIPGLKGIQLRRLWYKLPPLQM